MGAATDAATARPRHSVIDYARREAETDERLEWTDGEIRPASRGSARKSLISVNIAARVGRQIRPSDVHVFDGGLRLRVAATGCHAYPTISIVSGKPLLAKDLPGDTLTNPTVILEVLSDSTEAHDRGKKFHHFRQIPTLREYVLDAQDEPSVEVFRRVDGAWTYHHFAGLDAVARFESVGVELPLAEVYVGTEDLA